MYWHIAPEWKGETAFIVGGGTSVLQQDLSLLRGRRVIVVNSSYEVVPSADILYFADRRWYFEHRNRPAFLAFAGRKVTCSSNEKMDSPGLLRLLRIVPNFDSKFAPVGPGIAAANHAVVSNRTSLQGAMNMAVHLGVKRIVLLGADMRRAENGTTHHHSAHPWHNKQGNKTWQMQLEQLKLAVDPLRQRGIEVVNTSSISLIPAGWGWDCKTLEESVTCAMSDQPSIACSDPAAVIAPNTLLDSGDKSAIAS